MSEKNHIFFDKCQNLQNFGTFLYVNMWGEEGERIKQQRLANRELLKQQLKAQIEENAIKRQIYTPENQIKSTYESMTAQNQIVPKQYPVSPQRQQYQPPISSNLVPFHNQNMNRNNYNQIANRQYPQNSYQVQRPYVSPTSIAPIAINFSSIKADVPPVMSRVQHSSVVDPSAFSQRISSVELIETNIQNALSQTTATHDILEGNSIPQILTQIDVLKSDIDHLSSTEIQTFSKRLLDSSKYNRNLVDSSTTQINNEIAGLRERISEANAAITQFSSSFLEFSESSKAATITAKSDLQKHKQLGDTSTQRIDALMQRLSKGVTDTATFSKNFDIIDSGTTKSFSSLQSSMAVTTQQISRQLSEQIRNVSEIRSRTSGSLQAQVQEVNHRASSAINSLNNFVGELTKNFSSMLGGLSSSISQAIEQTVNDCEAFTADVSSRCDQILTESEANFNAIRNELVQTITDLKDGTTSSLVLLEQTLQEESEARKKNSQEIRDKYSHFADAIKKEVVIQGKAMEDMARNAELKGRQHIHNNGDSIIRYLSPTLQNAKKLEEIDNQLTQLEGVMQVLSSQFTEAISNLSRNLNELKQKMKTCQEEINMGFKEYNDKLSVVTDPSLTENNVFRDELHRFSSIFDADVDSKLDDLENQISVLMSNLSEITLGYPTNKQLPPKTNTNSIPKFEYEDKTQQKSEQEAQSAANSKTKQDNKISDNQISTEKQQKLSVSFNNDEISHSESTSNNNSQENNFEYSIKMNDPLGKTGKLSLKVQDESSDNESSIKSNDPFGKTGKLSLSVKDESSDTGNKDTLGKTQNLAQTLKLANRDSQNSEEEQIADLDKPKDMDTSGMAFNPNDFKFDLKSKEDKPKLKQTDMVISDDVKDEEEEEEKKEEEEEDEKENEEEEEDNEKDEEEEKEEEEKEEEEKDDEDEENDDEEEDD